MSQSPGLQRNQSLQRAVDLLRALAEVPQGSTVTQLARSSGLPVPTVRRLVATLADAGLAEQHDGGWVLGHELVRLGRAADPYVAVVARARPYLEELAERVGETAVLGASRLPHGVDVICQADTPRMVGIASWVGRSFGLHASAGARIAFACVSDDEIRATLGPGPLHRYTPSTITDVDDYVREIARVRRTGVAESVDELEVGLASIALPIGEIGEACRFSVGICGPTSRVASRPRAEMLAQIATTAQSLDALLRA
jgi:IclR family acetate operon transcriptional repressor